MVDQNGYGDDEDKRNIVQYKRKSKVSGRDDYDYPLFLLENTGVYSLKKHNPQQDRNSGGNPDAKNIQDERRMLNAFDKNQAYGKDKNYGRINQDDLAYP